MTKIKHLSLFVAACMAVATAQAQNWQFEPAPDFDQLALEQLGNLQSLDEEPEPMGFGLMSSPTPQVSASGNAADAIFPEIENLAASLSNDPARIFEFVYNNIDYEHYFGSRKGARLTLIEGSGNDMDQSALLVALLRSSGYDAGYAHQWNLVQYANSNPQLPTGVSWLGLSAQPNTGYQGALPADWTQLQWEQTLVLLDFFQSRGFEALWFTNFPGYVLAKRTVAVVEIGSETYRLDVSAKPRATASPMNVLAATDFDKSAFLSTIGGTPGTHSISGLNETAVQQKLADATESLRDEIRATRSQDTVETLLGKGAPLIVQLPSITQNFELLPRIESTPYVSAFESSVSTSLMSRFSIQVNATTAEELFMPELAGQRLSISHEGNNVRFWLEDTQIFYRSVSAATYEVTLRAIHPKSGDTDPLHDDDTVNTYKKDNNFAYAIIYAFNPSQRFLRYRNDQLDGIMADIRASDPSLFDADGTLDFPNLTDSTLRRRVITELLNIMGLNWLYQTEQANKMVAALTNTSVVMHHRFGRMGQEEGFYVDVGLQRAGNFARDGSVVNVLPYMGTFAYLFSALEHGIIDQYEFESNAAVSTIQIFHLANASTDPAKNTIYFANSANWSTVSTQLVGYDLSALQAKVNNGSQLILPKNSNNGDSGWDWDGSGYIEIASAGGTTSIGMIITGDYETSGGWNTTNSFVNTAPIVTNTWSTPNYNNYSGVSSISIPSTPTFNTPSFYGWDPVDMATGAFVFDRTDLETGLDGARGLAFARHYSSNRRANDSPALGYGWTHNYHLRATRRTAPEAGLGETTAYEASPMLAAAAIIAELVEDPENLKEMVAGALLAKYAVDNLLNNAVSITFGKENVQFVRQPDGTWTAPAGSTLTLTEDGTDWIVTERFGPTWTFDQTNGGRIASLTGYFGHEKTFAYDSGGRLETVTDSENRTLTFGYQNDRITSVTESTGRSVSFQYNSDGQLTHATDPEGKTARFYYDSDSRMTELRDPEDRIIVQNFYDTENRVYRQLSEGDTDKEWTLAFSGFRNSETDPLGGAKVYSYDKRGRPVSTWTETGDRTRMFYTGQDHMSREITPGGHEVRSLFDPDHNLRIRSEAPLGYIQGFLVDSNFNLIGFSTSSQIPAAGIVTTHTYDALHRPTETRVKDLTNTHPDRVTLYTYLPGNDTHLPDSVTDPEGNVTEFTYHPDGQVHTETAVSASGNRTTTYTYDSHGMPATITYPDSTTESFTYNQRGDLLTETDRRGHTTTYQYNHRRELTQTTAPDGGITLRTFDDNGNLETVTDPEGNVTRQTWSPQKKLLTVTTAFGTPEAATTTHEYDERDWRVRTIDPLGRTTHYEHDAAGRVIKLTDPLGRETHFTFDADGNRTSITTPEGILTQHGYNERGEQITMTDPAANTVTYTHNAFGEQTELENRRGHSYTFTHNKNSQLLTLSTPLGHTTTTNYNDLGEATSIVKPSGQTTTFTHDNMGRVATQTDDVGTITFGYDNGDNPTSVTEGSAVLTRTFDNMGRVTSYTDASGNTVEYEWDKNGRLVKLTYPDNREITYTYDRHNRLKTVTDWANRITTYHWDAAGRLIGIDRPNGTTRTNEYTLGDELERYYERGPGGILQAYARFGYDLDSRIDWRYRLPKPQEMELPTFTATHDADNRVATWNSQSVIHDNDGNMTFGPLPGESNFVNYSFDARNRLTGVGGVTYTYDAENNRIAKTTADGTTTYVFDPHGDALPRVLVLERPDESVTYYVYGIGLLYEVDEADNATYYHFDQSGSTIALTNDAGEVTDRVEYTPYGTISHRTGETDTPFLYAGQFGIQADANGLLHMRARYYSPELKRFINADPAGFDGGMNWYAYANNSPLMYVDPDGEHPVLTAVVGGLVGGIAGGLIAALDGNPHTTFRGGFIGGAITGATIGSGVGLLGRVAFTTARGASTIGAISFGGGVFGNTATQYIDNRRAGFGTSQSIARIRTGNQLISGATSSFSTVTFGIGSAGLNHLSNRMIDAGLNRGANYVSGLASTGILSSNQLNAASNRLLNPLLRVESATRAVTGTGGLRNNFSSATIGSGYGGIVNSAVNSFK